MFITQCNYAVIMLLSIYNVAIHNCKDNEILTECLFNDEKPAYHPRKQLSLPFKENRK